MKKIVIDEKNDKKKLHTFLFSKFPHLNKNVLYKALRKKDIKVNGKRVNDNITLSTNDLLEIYIADELLPPSNININSKYTFTPDIIFEDQNIVVINKPSQMEVVGEKSLTSLLQEYYKINFNQDYIMPCHRLDRNTTGVILYAKNSKSLDILLQAFKEKEIEKHYYAKVYGKLKKQIDTLEAYLFKDRKQAKVYISNEPKKGYLDIITSYKVIHYSQKENTSILDVQIPTGRTHQIRAHLAHIGYPIIGDGKYGINQINREFKKKYQELVSYSLTFHFNQTNELNYLNNQTISLKQIPFKGI